MMFSSKVLAFALVAAINFSSFSAHSYSNYADISGNSFNQNSAPAIPTDDSAVIKAVEAQQNSYFIAGANMEVVSILPDDTTGLQHQKFNVRLSNGKTVMAVYNLDMCERVPIKAGDRVTIGGQFIWTNDGGLLHWLHRDPRQTRPDGYVELAGKFYCK